MWRGGCAARLCAALAVLLLSAEGKVVTKRLRLGMPSWKSGARREDWQFAGKFGYGIGLGEYKFRLRETFPKLLKSSQEFEVELYLDEDWPAVEAKPQCERAMLSRRNRTIAPGDFGEWGKWVNGTLRQSVRPHIWYFAISDCKQSLTDDQLYKFEVEFEARQQGGSEFSIEAAWSLATHALMLAGFTVFLFFFQRRTVRFYDKNGGLHPVIWTLIVIMLVQYVAEVLHTGHLVMYRSNGAGSGPLEVLAEVFAIVAQVAETSLLITIASGYTLTRSSLGDLDIVPLVLVIIAFINIVVAVTEKMQEETANRFTEFEGLKGWLFLGFRVAVFIWFWLAARWTADDGGGRTAHFLGKFRVAASLYFLSYPLMFFVVQVFAPYWRKPVMESGMMLAQVCSNFWLSSLFLTRGAYFEASSLGMSPLPGGSSPVRFFKDE